MFTITKKTYLPNPVICSSRKIEYLLNPLSIIYLQFTVRIVSLYHLGMKYLCQNFKVLSNFPSIALQAVPILTRPIQLINIKAKHNSEQNKHY